MACNHYQILAGANATPLRLWSSYWGCHLLACRADNAVRSLGIKGFLPGNPKGEAFVTCVFKICMISPHSRRRQTQSDRGNAEGLFCYVVSCKLSAAESPIVILWCIWISPSFRENVLSFNKIKIKNFRSLCRLAVYWLCSYLRSRPWVCHSIKLFYSTSCTVNPRQRIPNYNS